MGEYGPLDSPHSLGTQSNSSLPRSNFGSGPGTKGKSSIELLNASAKKTRARALVIDQHVAFCRASRAIAPPVSLFESAAMTGCTLGTALGKLASKHGLDIEDPEEAESLSSEGKEDFDVWKCVRVVKVKARIRRCWSNVSLTRIHLGTYF